MPRPTKQAPPPLQVDTARVVLVGIALWTVALVVLMFLVVGVVVMWTWTGMADMGLAVLGLWMLKLQVQLRRRDGCSRD